MIHLPKPTFQTFVSIYICAFTLAGILLVLVRPPSVMKYIREMVGSPMHNVSNLVIESSAFMYVCIYLFVNSQRYVVYALTK